MKILMFFKYIFHFYALCLFSGEITVRTPSPAFKLRQKVQCMLENGELTTGTPIQPRTYKRVVLKKGEIKEDTFTVIGSKIPLMGIRKHFLHQHEKAGLMRDHSKEAVDNMSMEDKKIFLSNVGEKPTPEATYDEIKYMYNKVLTTRYLLMSQDHSTIANRGHLLLMVRCLHDPAIFYTPQEML